MTATPTNADATLNAQHLQQSPWQTTPGGDPESLLSPSEWVAQKAAELDTLKRELGALRESVGQQQKCRVADLHRGREKRIEAIMTELLPLPDTLQVAAPPAALLEAVLVPTPRASTGWPSTAPVATPSRRAVAAAAPMVTPSTSRTTALSCAASHTSLASSIVRSKRAPPAKAKPGPTKPPAPPRPAPAVAALAAQMHESKYNRPARIMASTTIAVAAAKQRPK